jgi:hypothetical protein
MAINTAPLVGKWLIAPAIARVTIIVETSRYRAVLSDLHM